MTSLEAMRRFGPWLFGLFLVAQIAGVVPLFSDHTHHVFESKEIVSGDVIAGGHGWTHRHGLADLNDQCCAFHQLMGVLPYAASADRVGFAKVRIVARSARALVPVDPNLLERPPKPLLSI